MFYLCILSGAFLGWGLGANDSANVFGTAVYTRIVRYSTAVIVTAIFVILGAVIDGHEGIDHISAYAYEGGIDTLTSAFFVMISAGLTVMVMTLMKLPVSTSQALVGAIIGGGIIKGTADFSATIKFLGAWFLTPIGGMLIAFIIYKILREYLEDHLTNFAYYQSGIKLGYLVAGAFGAYSLGANNVANVTGIFSGELMLLSTRSASIIGGIAIAFGVVTYSKPVMSTIGERIVPMTPIAGLIVVVSASITIYIYARIGIPVSSSQAVVGSIIGIGINAGVNTINYKMLQNVVLGWFATPTIAGIISLSISSLLYL